MTTDRGKAKYRAVTCYANFKRCNLKMLTEPHFMQTIWNNANPKKLKRKNHHSRNFESCRPWWIAECVDNIASGGTTVAGTQRHRQFLSVSREMPFCLRASELLRLFLQEQTFSGIREAFNKRVMLHVLFLEFRRNMITFPIFSCR